MKISKRALLAAVPVALLALPAAAAAHVTLQPDTAPAGGFVRLDVRVPNERDDAATDKVEVQMPDGFVFASYEPVAGWKTQVKSRKLDQPIETDDGPVDAQVSTITWTATDPAAAIQPGQFRDFGLSVGLPDQYAEGDALTFPSIQTYDNGEVVRWIGAPDSDEPAPQVTLTAAEGEHGHAAPEEDEAAAAPPASGSDDDSSGAPTWLAILGLVVGAAGLVAGGLALSRSPRPA
jgi:uncharacterized protein